MRKKTKLTLIVYIIAAFLTAFVGIQQLFFDPEPDKELIFKSILYSLIFAFLVTRFLFTYIRANQNMLRFQYLPFFAGAFPENKKSYKKLLSIGKLLNNCNYEEAYAQVEQLKNECVTTKDRGAVFLAEVLCLNGKMNYNSALGVLEKILFEQPGHLTALALRALLEQRIGMHAQALETFREILPHAKRNYAVHLCKAIYHFNRSEYEAAITAAKNALSIEDTSILSMFLIYKSNLALQDTEVADYYIASIKKYEKTPALLEEQLHAFLL